MKRINFNIKDRRILSLGLCLILICVFTLTIAYAALNAVLTIQGSAEVSAANWDIHFDNIFVDSGSVVATKAPVKIDSSTIDFSVVLSKPGDYYKFTVDVVNEGTVDAMIDSIIKLPELTTEEAKIIKYEITYSDGLPISEKHLLAAGSSEKISVELKYRTDIIASDLLSTNVVLDLSIKANYIQADEDFVKKPNTVRVVSGNLNTVGSELAIGNEHFYLVSNDGSTVKMLAKYNLYVGNYCNASDNCVAYGADATGIQDSLMVGKYVDDRFPRYGTISFSSDEKKGTYYCTYVGSIAEEYVNNYKNYLESLGVAITEARLINSSELNSLGCVGTGTGSCDSAPSWVYSTSYWTNICLVTNKIEVISSKGVATGALYSSDYIYGVRPLVIISIDEF